jgi:hypothetical protein
MQMRNFFEKICPNGCDEFQLHTPTESKSNVVGAGGTFCFCLFLWHEFINLGSQCRDFTICDWPG